MIDALVFDLGGTYLRCGRASGGRLIDWRQSPIANYTHGLAVPEIWDRIFKNIAVYCDAHRSEVAPEAPIIFAVPTPVEDGVIFNAPTVTGTASARIDVAASVRRLTGRPRVHVLNDLAAAAWWAYDNYREDRIFVVTISSGIGSKLLVRSCENPVLDSPLYAGEIGHLRVQFGDEAPLCGCGQPGHLSAISSGRGVLELARAAARRDPAGFDASQCGGVEIDTLSNELHIVPAARNGDLWIRAVLHEAIDPLAQLLITVTLAAGVEKVVIIGGFAQALGTVYLDIVRDMVAASTSYAALPPTTSWIELATEKQPCLAGAAAYAAHLGVDAHPRSA